MMFNEYARYSFLVSTAKNNKERGKKPLAGKIRNGTSFTWYNPSSFNVLKLTGKTKNMWRFKVLIRDHSCYITSNIIHRDLLLLK